MHIPLLLRNDTTSPQEIRLSSALPQGWIDRTKYAVYPVAAGTTYAVQVVLDIPGTETRGWRQIAWNAVAGGQQVGSVTMHVSIVTRQEEGGLPQ